MRVLLLSKYPRKGASSRLRSLQYLPYLNSRGINVVESSLFDERYLNSLYQSNQRSVLHVGCRYFKRLCVLFTLFRYDVLWIEKEVFPYFPAVVERLLKLMRKPFIVDYDDAIFHNYDLSSNALIRRVLGQKIDRVMAYASHVVAGNEYLAARATRAGSTKITIIPTVVDHTRYNPVASPESKKLIIGWIGSPSTEKYVVAIREPLIRLCREHDARLLLVGATDGVRSEFDSDLLELQPWSEASEPELISRMDIGIMPLADGPWERGKCGYKLIQYMASGKPVIASPVGVNVDIVNDAACGLLAGDDEGWGAALEAVLSDSTARARLGQQGRAAVEERYSLQAQAPRLAEVIIASANTSY